MVSSTKLISNGQGSGGFGIPIQESRRSLSFIRGVLRGLSSEEFESRLQPLMQRVVQEEVERGVQRFLHRYSQNSVGPSEASCLELKFVNNLPSTIFTGSRISVDNAPIEVVIVDSRSKNRIVSGPFSSFKVEILVLDGDFIVNEQADWTEKELNCHIVRAREGRRPLVAGEQILTLKGGIGCIGEISFTDNSSWTRSGKFRLLAKAVKSNSDVVRIKEAISDRFKVKDHRGELYKKHFPPSLGDKVWRLKKISKDGVYKDRLASKGIDTVRDFLRLHSTDPTLLRNVLGGGVSNKMWETIVRHAITCVVDDLTLYMYYSASKKVGLLLNSIYKAVGVSFDGHNYQRLDNLNSYQKHLVDDLNRHAYENIHQWVVIDEPSVLGIPRSLFCQQADPSNDPSFALQHPYSPVNLQDQQGSHLVLNPSTSSTGYKITSQMEIPTPQPMQVFSPTPRNSSLSWNLSFELPSATDHFVNDISLVQSPPWFPDATEMNDCFGVSSSGAQVDILSSLPSYNFCIAARGKSKAGWCKIRAAVKWKILVGQVVAAKRMARLGYSF